MALRQAKSAGNGLGDIAGGSRLRGLREEQADRSRMLVSAGIRGLWVLLPEVISVGMPAPDSPGFARAQLVWRLDQG